MSIKLLDLLYRINCQLSTSKHDSLKLRGICRKFVLLCANTIIPLSYNISSRKKNNVRTLPLIVSLTSFPARIDRVWITIESMLRQTVNAEKIILWLSSAQFPHKEKSLPISLLKLCDTNLEIKFVDDDIRSFKKFYYAFQDYPDKGIITIDDDLLFPSTFLEQIYDCAIRHPDSVIANFGFKFRWDDNLNYLKVLNTPIEPDESGQHLFFGSGGGTLFYPQKMLPYMDDIANILRMCPTADDIYLNSLCRLAGLDITFMSNSPLLSIWNKSDIKLDHLNGPMSNANSRNAEQLRKLVEFTEHKYNINPFIAYKSASYEIKSTHDLVPE